MQNELTYKRSVSEVKDFSLLKFICCVIGSELTGFLSGLAAMAFDGYDMNLAPFTPSMPVMVVIWAVMYLLMGWSLYLALQHNDFSPSAKRCKTLYIWLWATQMVFNFMWPIIIFRWQLYTFGFVWLAILDALVTALVVTAFKLRPAAALLLLPYLLWLLGATYSNIMLIILN